MITRLTVRRCSFSELENSPEFPALHREYSSDYTIAGELVGFATVLAPDVAV